MVEVFVPACHLTQLVRLMVVSPTACPLWVKSTFAALKPMSALLPKADVAHVHFRSPPIIAIIGSLLFGFCSSFLTTFDGTDIK